MITCRYACTHRMNSKIWAYYRHPRAVEAPILTLFGARTRDGLYGYHLRNQEPHFDELLHPMVRLPAVAKIAYGKVY